jgi:hypothetical protein
MVGQAAIHQANAVGSWLAIPDAEVLVYGPNAPAPHLRIRHIQSISSNVFGTPLLDAMFATAQRIARHELICFANGDIIFLDDLERFAPRLAGWPRFLSVGRRQNLNLDAVVDFAPGWCERLRGLALEQGAVDSKDALDYFLFRRGTISAMPAFAIGRPAWDNWMIMDALCRRIPLIESTRAILVIHQRHDYDHAPARSGQLWEGPEADENRALARAHPAEPRLGLYYTTDCATWVAGKRWFWPGLGLHRLCARWRAARNTSRFRSGSAATRISRLV